jgi:hypothetical protein
LTPGTILHDQQFPFSDGTKGNKLVVLLTPLVDGYFYIGAKTTSRENRRGKKPGCQHKDIYPNFFIPKGTSTFPTDTWVSLDEFYEFKSTELIQRHFSGEIKTIDNLESSLTIKLLSCTLQSQDITFHQEKAIKAALHELTIPPK